MLVMIKRGCKISFPTTMCPHMVALLCFVWQGIQNLYSNYLLADFFQWIFISKFPAFFWTVWNLPWHLTLKNIYNKPSLFLPKLLFFSGLGQFWLVKKDASLLPPTLFHPHYSSVITFLDLFSSISLWLRA